MRKFMFKYFPSIALFLSSLCFFACHQESSKSAQLRPNIVWINVEDISPALGCYGDTLAITPNLDRMASEGILFSQAFSTAPICAPSRSSFITGVYSTSMGTQHLRSEVNRASFIKTLPEHLKELQYFTTNYGKTDWNFSPDGVFDLWEQDLAPWRKRPDNQPFFSMFVAGKTHEGSVNKLENYHKAVEGLPREFFHDTTHFPVPGSYPQTQEFRTLFAHYYDLISQMDRLVGEILDNLEADGLKEETVVFFFSDHGFGIPRYKRYLYKSGTHVPLLVYLPPKYRHWSTVPAGQVSDQLVSLVDMTPSILNMLGIDKPEYMQGQAFLGEKPEPARDYIYVERSRADDLFEMSRGITDGKYLYVRHYMPYLPYIRSGVIQADATDKIGYSTLRKMHDAGTLPAVTERLFHPKPLEELYNLDTDPFETDNLAGDTQLQTIKTQLSQQLFQWSLITRDLGFLPEAEYMIRGSENSPYEIAQNDATFPVEVIMQSAQTVGYQDEKAILQNLRSPESGVNYWAVIATRSLDKISTEITDALTDNLSNSSPSVQIAAAEALCQFGAPEKALPVLKKWVLDDRPWLALQAARSAVEIGPKAKPIVEDLLKAQAKYIDHSPNAPRKYVNFNYASFTGWALERAIQNCEKKPL